MRYKWGRHNAKVKITDTRDDSMMAQLTVSGVHIEREVRFPLRDKPCE